MNGNFKDTVCKNQRQVTVPSGQLPSQDLPDTPTPLLPILNPKLLPPPVVCSLLFSTSLFWPVKCNHKIVANILLKNPLCNGNRIMIYVLYILIYKSWKDLANVRPIYVLSVTRSPGSLETGRLGFVDSFALQDVIKFYNDLFQH